MSRAESCDPLVSVVIPYHNEGDLVRRAVQSVAGQVVAGGVEILVVDDASREPPPLKGGGDWPVRVVRSEENLHAAGARNRGISEARGRYLCFLDADDEYLPDRVAPHVEFLESRPGVVMVGGPWYMHREDVWLQMPGPIQDFYPWLRGTACVLPRRARYDVCTGYPFATCAMTIRRDALLAVRGFDPEYRWGEEWDLLVRLAQMGELGYVPQPTFRYLCREASVTTTLDPTKFDSGARMFRRWRKEIGGMPAEHRRCLKRRERQYALLGSQVYLETCGQPRAALARAAASLLAGPSWWAVRSTLRSGFRVGRQGASWVWGRLVRGRGACAVPAPGDPGVPCG